MAGFKLGQSEARHEADVNSAFAVVNSNGARWVTTQRQDERFRDTRGLCLSFNHVPHLSAQQSVPLCHFGCRIKREFGASRSHVAYCVHCDTRSRGENQPDRGGSLNMLVKGWWCREVNSAEVHILVRALGGDRSNGS